MVKKILRKFHLNNLRDWVVELGIPNIDNPKKLLRGIKWSFLCKYIEYPPFIVIDPIVKCNLDCPLCSIPPRLLPNYGSRLSLGDFKNILDNVKNVTNKILFCHAGEPFLNAKLLDMVKAVNDAHLISLIGTNGTLLNSKNIQKIFDSGLDYLQISFDGFSKESYEKYRVGADFNKALLGVTELAKKKKNQRRRKPFIEVTFLINAYNDHEVNAAKKYFTDLGIRFKPKGINLNTHRRKDGKSNHDLAHWVAFNHKYSLFKKDENGNIIHIEHFREKCETCQKPVINCDGEILLCCHDIFKTVKLGNIRDYEFKEFWMDKRYRNLREMGSQRKLPLCKECGI